jgi:hypothetical protein
MAHQARQYRIRSSGTSEGPGVLPTLTSHHAFSTSRAPSPYPLFPLCPQYVYTIRDDRRGLFDALIHFLRFLRYLRSNLSVKTSHWWGRWLDRAKDAHAQCKSSSKLPSLYSTQRPYGALRRTPSLPSWGREPRVCRGILQVITRVREPSAPTAASRPAAQEAY